MQKNKDNLLKEMKKNYPTPTQLLSSARHATSLDEFKKYEKMLFDAVILFANDRNTDGEEKYSFYPTFAYALMKDCLAGKTAFATEFNYKKFFEVLLASNNKCNIGQAIYLYRYLSLGNTLSSGELSEEENEAFNLRKKQFYDTFDTNEFLSKCDKLKLVGKACDEEDYSFLYNSVNQQEK